MAGIDKTYVKTWQEYQDLVNWLEQNQFKCPNGDVIGICHYGWSKEDFDGERERPVLNTTQEEDYFLIKYCPLQFVQDRMKEVYDEEDYNSVKNGTSPYDTFTKEGRLGTGKIKLKKLRGRGKKYKYLYWTESLSYGLRYCTETNKWLWPYELGNWNTSTADRCHSIKALIRQIRKWQLPKGTGLRIYCGTNIWLAEVK